MIFQYSAQSLKMFPAFTEWRHVGCIHRRPLPSQQPRSVNLVDIILPYILYCTNIPVSPSIIVFIIVSFIFFHISTSLICWPLSGVEALSRSSRNMPQTPTEIPVLSFNTRRHLDSLVSRWIRLSIKGDDNNWRVNRTKMEYDFINRNLFWEKTISVIIGWSNCGHLSIENIADFFSQYE